MLSLFFAFTAVLLASFAVMAARLRAPLLVLVAAALTYDNAVIAVGSTLGEGQTLMVLNAGRFWAHALITPLLVVVGWRLARLTRPAVMAGLVAVLVAYGVYTEIVRLRLEPLRENGTLRYINAAAEGPPIAAIVTIVVLIVLGAIVWRRLGTPWLLLGAVAMFIAAALGVHLVWLQNFGEAALLASLLLTTRHPHPPPR